MKLYTLALLLAFSAGVASAQEPAAAGGRVRVRATLSGSSETSASGSYKVYSGTGLEVGFARGLGDHVGFEIALRTESREVEGPRVGGSAPALGSLELLPVMLAAQWRFGGASTPHRPYVGAGMAAIVVWEKSGALDSTDVPSHVGPLLQLGFDQRLTPSAWLNLDVRWSTLRIDLREFDAGAAKVKVDPLVLGFGMAFAL